MPITSGGTPSGSLGGYVKGVEMSFNFFGVEIPDTAKIIFSYEEEETGFTSTLRVVDDNRMERPPGTKFDVTFPVTALIPQKNPPKTVMEFLESETGKKMIEDMETISALKRALRTPFTPKT